MQIAASAQLRSVFGHGADGSVKAVAPVTPARGARSGGSWSLEDQAFGAALIREARRPQEPPLYGPDARLRGSGRGVADEEAGGERVAQQLEQREQEVRRNVEARGEAVGGVPYIYQTGPDGKMYAIGTAPHVVRNEKSDDGTEDAAPAGAVGSNDLDSADRAFLQRLEARDSLVRRHEAAHITAAGPQARGPARYTYQTGPDGRSYAVGGSVNISIVSSATDPEDAARQAKTAVRTASAVGDMSPADARVAARAREISARAGNRAMDAYAGQAAMTPS